MLKRSERSKSISFVRVYLIGVGASRSVDHDPHNIFGQAGLTVEKSLFPLELPTHYYYSPTRSVSRLVYPNQVYLSTFR